jgi:hypothetical protein
MISCIRSWGVKPKTINMMTITTRAIAVLMTVFNKLNKALKTSNATINAAMIMIKLVGIILPVNARSVFAHLPTVSTFSTELSPIPKVNCKGVFDLCCSLSTYVSRYSTDFNNSGLLACSWVFCVVPLHQLLVAVVEQPTISLGHQNP